TTFALMLLFQQGSLNLDQTLHSAIPDFSGTSKKDVTIRQLLSHAAGLPDYRPYYKTLTKHPSSERKSILREFLLDEALIHEPGRASLYSDVGFMILEWLIEVTAKKSLDRFVEESVYEPLRLKDLFFVPFTPTQTLPLEGGGQGVGKGREVHPYAATEDCPWRGKILDGEVHDENAYALGGVAGHAGLFGTAQDVYGLLKEILNVYAGKPNRGLFRRDLVQTFFQRQTGSGSWALGFDTPAHPNSSSGRYFSDQSIGHLGFTGTSFWVDLQKAVVVILLTNRIHPTRQNEKIRDFRPLLHDAIMDTILIKSGISFPNLSL
ncbi:MAG: serine hydrolase, partial [Desulfobacterales bacterium]|nr:serine hydrolase [Desulfobacterales bacterium]